MAASVEAPEKPLAGAAQPSSALDVFISYSRRDALEFAKQLKLALDALGHNPIIDLAGISAGEDFEKRLGDMIAEADTVVFVLSPESTTSPVCAWEIDEALRKSKRILPILAIPLGDAPLPAKIAKTQYIPFCLDPKIPDSGFGHGIARLATALKSDLEWLREHKNMLIRAEAWQTRGGDPDRLIRGKPLEEAEHWLARRPHNAPDLTPTQHAFLEACRQAEEASKAAAIQQIAEMQSAQEARAKALGEREIAVAQAADAQRRRALFRNLLLIAMTAIAAVFAWSWHTISEGNRRLATQVQLSRIAAETAQLAQRRAQEAEFDAVANECTASKQLLNAPSATPEHLHDYLNCSVRFAYALVRKGQPEAARLFLEKTVILATPNSPEEDSAREFYLLSILQAIAVAESVFSPLQSAQKRSNLVKLVIAAQALLSYRPPSSLDHRWREEIFRGLLYLSNLSNDEGEHEKSFSYAGMLVQRLSISGPANESTARDLARALDHFSWTALLTKRFSEALEASQRADTIISGHQIHDLKALRLNYAHALLLNGSIAEARQEYLKFTPDDLADDFAKLKAAGVCHIIFSELVGENGRCGVAKD